MNGPMIDQDLDRFRQIIAGRLGLSFPGTNQRVLSDILQARTEHLACNSAAYLTSLEEGNGNHPEWQIVTGMATVGETYFFRNRDQFQALCLAILPMARRTHDDGGGLRILSAACSTGEEAYTLAMMLMDNRDLLGGLAYSIDAIDVNASAIARAQKGVYSTWSMRETPPDLRERYFTRIGQGFAIKDAIRHQVSFEHRNLITPDEAFWLPGRFDVIFFRNALMYLVPEAARNVVARLARSLTPGGHLFLGHAETLRGLSDDFQLCNSHGTFYYRLASSRSDADTRGPISPHYIVSACTFPSEKSPQNEWIGEIGRSSERVENLAFANAQPHQIPQGKTVEPSAPTGHAQELDQVADLLRQERFTEARALLESHDSRISRLPLARLMMAVVDAHSGEYMRAEATCRTLLSEDPRNARVLFLLALCREQSGDIAVASDLYRSSSSNDARFAMPHVRLALLARRRREDQEAHRFFGSALVRIDREDDLNIALFSGGFSREAIADLCRGHMKGMTG